MKRKKPTRKDFEAGIIDLNVRLNNLTGFVNGIAEILNEFIEFGGKSKKFYDKLKEKVKEEVKKENPKDIPDTDKSSK